MARRKSPSRSSSGRKKSRTRTSRRRTSRRPKNPNKVHLRLGRYKADPSGQFNPEVMPAADKSTKKMPVTVTMSRDLRARHTAAAFIGCVRVAKEMESCSRGRNPRVALAAAFRKAATAVNKRRGGMAALNLAGFAGGSRRRRRRKRR